MTTTSYYRPQDHFEPEANLDPQAQRKLRGTLEQIDYATFASNQGVLATKPGHVDMAGFQRLAVAAAEARARWVVFGLELAAHPHAISEQQVCELTVLRTAYSELAEVYSGLRRMVERGYLSNPH